jgi:hypothetical protein
MLLNHLNTTQIGYLICLVLVLIATWYFAIRPYLNAEQVCLLFSRR